MFYVIIGLIALAIIIVLANARRDIAASEQSLTNETRPFTYDDERRAADERLILWMRYVDAQGKLTERTVHIYAPEDDDYFFGWCNRAQAPRTFRCDRIQAWKLLDERFRYDPRVIQWWKAFHDKPTCQQMDWQEWLQERKEQSSKEAE